MADTPQDSKMQEVTSMSFSHLILSLATSAQIGMGMMPNPGSGKLERNIPMARQTIDLIAILQEKTQGNLTAEEAKLLDELLYTLRMQFLEAEKIVKG